MKVAITSSRSYNYGKAPMKALFAQEMDKRLSNITKPVLQVVAGDPADFMVGAYAFEHHLDRERFHPSSTKVGLRAYEEMFETSKALIAVWDGKEGVVKEVISLARDKGLKLRIVRL